MPQLFVQSIILLFGLFFLVLIVFTLNKTRDWKSCLLPLPVLGLIVAVGSVLDLEKQYQCAFETPDQIRVAGHLKGNSPNDHLVLLYRGGQEIDRYVTQSGKLDSEEQARDGFFELVTANELRLDRCSMALDFEQERAGTDVLWMQNKTTYLWHDFTDLGAGAVQVLNEAEPRKTYTLVVSADKVDTYPGELGQYSTYRDRAGNIAINVPIQKYRWEGSAFVAIPTGFYIHSGRLPETQQWPVHALARGVKTAWVVDDNPSKMEIRNLQDTRIIDRNNCEGEQPRTDPGIESIVYIKEVQFLESPDLDFDLGIAASEAADSLGFTHGQLGTYTITVPVYVPAGTHRIYKLFWRDVWRTGMMVIDFGSTNIQVPFRERIGMSREIEQYDVDCPQ